jgi:fructose-bisphosphate aldolase/2-amino-3,7-dideoxy-D-threo-hept-6-ulosonate synthase
MNTGKSLRLRRFFRHQRSVIIPMDHPMYSGPIAGLEDPVKTINRIAQTGADGVLVSPWLLPRAIDVMGQLAVVVRLDGSCSSLGPRVDDMRIVATVEQALNFGAEMVAINVFVGGDNESFMLEKLGETAGVCEAFGIPLLAEMIPANELAHHFGKSESHGDEAQQKEAVGIVSRIGAEYGGDVIKTVYTGDRESFAQVVQNTTIPVVVAGGPKSSNDTEFLEGIKGCVEAGAAGLCIGRNVWHRPRMEGMIAALCAITHENASVAEAARLL